VFCIFDLYYEAEFLSVLLPSEPLELENSMPICMAMTPEELNIESVARHPNRVASFRTVPSSR
jgi:hypothetical protein